MVCICGNDFVAKRKNHIRCSRRCVEKAYTLKHPERRKVSRETWAAKPESREKMYLAQRRRKLQKYGITESEFLGMLERQHRRCAGCGVLLGEFAGRADHNHSTGKFRGVLCDQCNWSLGFVHDDRARLYQLAAYLELDRTKPVVYLIGSLRNDKIVDIGNKIRAAGFEVVDNWFAAGKIADDSWQAYSNARGRTYQEALDSREAKHVFHFDLAYIHLSDIVVLVYPAGKSAHIEFGYAVAKGKPGYILLDEIPDRYDVMKQFAKGIYFDLPRLITALPRL